MSEKDDGEWRVQFSQKFGPRDTAMLNIRDLTLEGLLEQLRTLQSNAPEILSAAACLFPAAPPQPVPQPAAQPAAQPPTVQGIPGEVITTVTSAMPKLGKSGKTFYAVAFGDGSQATTFDTDKFVVAQHAATQSRMVAVLFKQKGDFRNIEAIRLLGAA